MKPEELARKAADVLRSAQLGRGRYCKRNLTGGHVTSISYCMLGAIMVADGCGFTGHCQEDEADLAWYRPSPECSQLVDELARVVMHKHPHEWSDRADRTKAEVLAALEIAAANLEAR
jgi:hypothetical protein